MVLPGNFGRVASVANMNRFVVFFVLILYSLALEARQKEYVSIGKIKAGHLGTWSIGDDRQIWTSIHCVASYYYYKNKQRDPHHHIKRPAVRTPYQLKVTDRAAPPGYYMYLNHNDTNTGNARIQVFFRHRDIKGGATRQKLSDDVYDSHFNKGQLKKCGDGDNSELQMMIPNSELAKARAGRFHGKFRVGVIGGRSGTATKRKNIEFSINISQSVRISGLDNINLGTWAGRGDIVDKESFCIYSNNSSAGYNVTVSSPQQDGTGNFRLANAGQTQFIAYKLLFSDRVGGAGTVVTNTSISSNGNNSSLICGGRANAELTVKLSEINLRPARSNSYSDTITLLIAPE